MLNNENLPIVLVSSYDSSSANRLISELFEDELIPEQNEASAWRTWRIQNKYYRADVALQAQADGQPPPLHLAARVEAHIVHLRTDEGEGSAERRLAEAGEISRRSHVRLAVMEGVESATLAAWASRRRYELVALREEGEDAGASRVRAALHAHTWRGLIRLDRPDAPTPDGAPSSSSSDAEGDSWGLWEAWRGEPFADLLGSLGAERGAIGMLEDAERRRRAELLLAAFRTALASDSASEAPQ